MFTYKKLLVVLLTFCSLSVLAQESISYKLYGFVRSDFYSDSRKMVASTQDLFSLYPYYKNDSGGGDLFATPSAGLMSITTRIGLDFESQAGILGAKKAISKIEVDFGGAPNFMILRIRQAYTQILWDHSNLLIGQTWHPLFAQAATQPNVLSLNTGAPFQPFNRSPQVRFNYQMNHIQLSAAAIYQMMYTSYGPDETTSSTWNTSVSSTSFQKNAMIPDVFVGVEYKKDQLVIGLGGDYKTIMPSRYITEDNIKRVNNHLLSTPAVMVYGGYTIGKLVIKAKALYGQNLTEHNIIGGYAISPDHKKYIPYNSLSSFIHFNYGKIHQLGLLTGFSANLGPSKTIPAGSNFYGCGIVGSNDPVNEKIIGNVFRLTPTYSYNIKNWRMGVELEYTNAAWGNRSPDNGKILNLDRSDNFRIYGVMMYKF
ncbi:MAG: hypothetical protein PHS30_06580 [Bacteroidales bacterium]|nr:hypothetical protein [Bacteroidales bacterium]